jgi:hypothetical protein
MSLRRLEQVVPHGLWDLRQNLQSREIAAAAKCALHSMLA